MCLLVYVTTASQDEARRIAKTLVEEGLAAGVNVIGRLESVYRWQGEVCQAEESAFLAKTTATRFDALAARVRELHSYELPCIVAVPLVRGEADFLDWIRANCNTP